MTFSSAAALTLLASTAHAAYYTSPTMPDTLDISVVGTYKTGVFDESATEIMAYDPATMQLVYTNAYDDTLDVLDFSDPANPTLITQLTLPGGPNSVDIHDGVAAVCVENNDGTQDGFVVFVNMYTLEQFGQVTVGNLPDMCTFTPDGKYVLSANEGEPNDDYTFDPEGSVSIVDVENMKAKTLDFKMWNSKKDYLISKGVRIYGPGATVAQDLEPEYITVSPDGKTALVVCQENNAFVVVDLKKMKISDIVPIGFKDHTTEGNEFDASNRDDKINIANYPTLGMYQPDGMDSFEVDGKTYYIVANEGDSRDYDGYSEEARFANICPPDFEDGTIDAGIFDDLDNLCMDENLGRLKITLANGMNDYTGKYEKVYSYGGRSFSIFNEKIEMIYDSGSWLEQITAAAIPNDFNSNNDENDSFDSRSDDKGPEPEAVKIAYLGGKIYAFVLMERVSGIAVFDVSDPYEPIFDQFFHNRDFSGDAAAGTAGDLGPEDSLFIYAHESPIGENLLVVANEVSGSITAYQVDHPMSSGGGKKGGKKGSGKGGKYNW